MPQELSQIVTPLAHQNLAEEFCRHPDQEFAAYIRRGVAEGFRIGFNLDLGRLKQHSGNMPSADKHPEVVSAYIEEREHGRLVKVDQAGSPPIHTSPFGVIPKEGRNNRWRLILDLSSPHGHNINDSIEKELASLTYVSVDEVVQKMLQLGNHYIDDFITAGCPSTTECATNTELMHAVCRQVGMPVEPEKDEGPATTITFLGLELDTVALEVRLPQDKLASLRMLLRSWRGRKAYRKRELLSLVGSMSHASRAVKPGRSYTCRLIEAAAATKRLDQFVRLNREARADIEWWHVFAAGWNGTAMMEAGPGTSCQVTIISDASGNWGCGAYSEGQWFMLPWSGAIGGVHITVKELAPIVVAAAIWGHSWRGKKVLAQCDNTAA